MWTTIAEYASVYAQNTLYFMHKKPVETKISTKSWKFSEKTLYLHVLAVSYIQHFLWCQMTALL